MQNKINSFQLFCILFISRLLGTFTYMVRLNTDLNTFGRIAMIAFYFLFSLLFSVPVFLFLRGQNNASVLNTLTSFSVGGRKFIASAYCAVFLLSAVITITRFGLFAGTVLLQTTSLYVFVLSLLIVSAYAARKGLQPIARTAVLFAFILAISLVFIQAGVLGQFQFINILSVQRNHITDIVKQAIFSACRNIEIPAVLFVADKVSGRINKTIFRFLSGISIVTALLFAVSGGVTGTYGEQQMFPLFTLSSLAKLGSVERMEDLLTGIWVVCAMIKIAFLLYVASLCLQQVQQKAASNAHTALLGALVFAGYFLLSADITKTINLLQSWLLPVGFLLFGVFLPLVLYLIAHKNEKQLHKENKI